MSFVQQKASKGHDDSHLTPLINIVFLMLIFFLVAGQIEASAPVDVAPPESAADALEPKDERLLYISQAGELFSQGGPIAREELGALYGDAQVLLIVDKQLTSEQLLPVLMDIKTAGAAALRIKTQRSEEVSP